MKPAGQAQNTGHLPLLLEIGTEELPPSVIRQAAEDLCGRVKAVLENHGLSAGNAQVFHTPRRLAVLLADVEPGKDSAVVEVQGPPKKVAFGPDGKPTRTAIGFAKAHGRQPEELYARKTDKGEYVFVKKQAPPVSTVDILVQELPGCIASLPFPRTMRWQEDSSRFPRPVRWLVCLLGPQVVPFRFAGLTADRYTWVKRTEAAAVALSDPSGYAETLARHHILCRPEDRTRAVTDTARKLCAQAGGTPVLDEELLEETTHITESPLPILCAFDQTYLTLPAEVLITALKKHQRCFAVKGKEGRLLPLFVAVTDTPGCDQKTVGRWYEHAVESRLRDARFYFEQDLSKGLETLVEEEKRVTWIEGIGSYYDKTEHLRRLCRHLAGETGLSPEEAARLDRAALLCKADLLTNMVKEKEFTSLQGRMGGIYARLLGEPAETANAIAEHYLPVSADSELPATRHGAYLSIADRVDNIVATFLSGAIPTGSEDPFGLRRAASGLLAIVLKHGLDINLEQLLSTALKNFPSPDQERAGKLAPFLQERLEAILEDNGIPYDIAAAVLETTWAHPVRALAAAKALISFRKRPEFEPLIIGQKRVANILKNQQVTGLPDPALFQETAEKELWAAALQAEPGIRQAMAAHDYVTALGKLLELRQPIDRLFDDVLVMTENEELRTNRLRLALYLHSVFRQVADLSKIVLEGNSK